MMLVGASGAGWNRRLASASASLAVVKAVRALPIQVSSLLLYFCVVSKSLSGTVWKELMVEFNQSEKLSKLALGVEEGKIMNDLHLVAKRPDALATDVVSQEL